MSSKEHPPLLKAAEIEQNLTEESHYLNAGAKRLGVCMSDMVGMSDLGVHFVRLPPNTESTTIHYHLNDSEWIYVLRGTATLLQCDASLALSHKLSDPPPTHLSEPDESTSYKSRNPDLSVEEFEVKQGDFMGWQGGIGASRWAHGLRSGPKGVEYIMGGTREKVDTCSYPTVGKTVVFDTQGEATKTVEISRGFL